MSLHANNVANAVSGTPGTGTITLGSAVSGAQSFASAYGANATVDVFITDGTAWEVARNCTYTHSGTTLSRGTLEASSTGSAISLTSAAVVRVAATADFGNRLDRALQAVTPGGRLTSESGVPVSTSDRTAQSTLYYTPYIHNVIPLWNGSDWVPTTFTETSLALGTLTSGRPYDVYGYLSGGALVLESLSWTNDTTRATAVTPQDGRYCKSGDKTRLLLGTFYTTATTTTEDSLARRYLCNVYNAIPRRFYATTAATYAHTYTTGAWREWNNGTNAQRINFVASIPNVTLTALMAASLTKVASTGRVGYVNIGYDAVDGTSNLSTNAEGSVASSGGANTLTVAVSLSPVPGRHFLAVTQYGEAAVEFYLNTIQGSILC